MTRERAIEILKRKTSIPEESETFEEISEAFDMAVKVFEEIKAHTERIERITNFLNELDLKDMNREELEIEIEGHSINELKYEAWRWYCFISDVCNTLNM